MLSDVFADLSAPGPLPVSGFDPRGHLGSSVPIFAIRYVLLFVHNVDHFEIVTAAGPANNSLGRATSCKKLVYLTRLKRVSEFFKASETTFSVSVSPSNRNS